MNKNLSNIELFHHKYLDRTPIIPTVSDDQLIVETVEYDTDEIREHADITYKKYETGKWQVFSYKCKHCLAVNKTVEKFATHLETCKGLDDDYVRKPKRSTGFM